MTISNTFGIKSKPLYNEKTGRKLNDEEFIRYNVKKIKEIEDKTHSPVNLPPNFRQWLFDAVDALDAGESVETFKKRTIVQNTIPDFDMLIKNTYDKHKIKRRK